MTFLYMWIIFCVGFISGATWAGLYKIKNAAESLIYDQTMGRGSDRHEVSKNDFNAKTESRNRWQKSIKTIATIPI